jgi:hypothetical protein
MLSITHVEMLPLETKQSGDKLLPHSDLRGGVFLEEVSCSRRRMRWAGHVARVGEDRGVYRVLVGKPEGKRL